MTELMADLQRFAAQLSQGPAFLLLGENLAEGFGDPSSQYRWSGVYTSRTDEFVAAKFRTTWRTVSPLGSMSAIPSRNPTDLQIRYLFGGRNLPESEQPPKNALQEADAKMRCLQELSRLTSETVTPRGVIAIEGLTPGDRLDVRDLVPTLRALGEGQVHLFSCQALTSDPFITSLTEGGQLVLHQESLDEAFTQLLEVGAVSTGQTLSARGTQHTIAMGSGFAEIDIHTWNQIRRTTRPIDLELLIPPVLSSKAARYQEFRNFAGATEGSPRWRGITANLNIRRDFENILATKVADALKEREISAPIILSGQTATGKSVALAALAIDLAKGGDVAVLHQSRRTIRPSVDDVDIYAAWAEDHGADATVLIWDGMTYPEEYTSFWGQLRNRGRKVLVIGSTYANSNSDFVSVEASPTLSEVESKQLVKLLHPFNIPAENIGAGVDSSFLAFLYHTLPDSHYMLRSGLASEMRAAEKGMAKLLRTRKAHSKPESRLSAMAAALQAAGINLDSLITAESSVDKPLSEQTFGERSAIHRVTTLILVGARHGVPVPIDLALRILGREGAQSIRDALRSFDIIREIADDSGEYFLTTRSHLEAELLAQQELSIEVEIEVITEIIRNARVHEYFNASDEVQYVVSLLERIGSNSPQARLYKPFYETIAEALRDRRQETGLTNYRLLLQESNFSRSYVHWSQNSHNSTADERIAILENNRDLLESSLSDETLRGMMRLSLTVELASTLGAITHEISIGSKTVQASGLINRLDDIFQAVITARAINPRNLHPVDVLAWSTRDAVQTNVLAVEERFDRLVSAVALIDSIDTSIISDKQMADLSKRSIELNTLLNNDEAVWANIRALEQNNDPAALYILASHRAGEGAEGETAALERLRNAPVAVRTDWRCAQLMLDLTWKSFTGQKLLRGERTPVHLSNANASQLLKLTSDISGADLPDKYKSLFVGAIAQFALGNYPAAKSMFRETEQITRQLSTRIHTLTVLADNEGVPETFTGRVEWADRHRGEVWVNEIGTTVAFEPRLFSASHEFSRHQTLPAFMIGFKFSRGPVAEPRNMYRRLREK